MAGIDEGGPQLFETDPSGALMEYKASSVGSGRNQAMEVFEEKYKDGSSQDDAVTLGLQALYKATDGKLNAEAIEIGVVTLKDSFRKFTPEEVRRYVEKVTGGK